MSFLIYGVNGFTGERIVDLAVKNGLTFTIAGRSESKIKPLAEKYGLPYLAFGLDNPVEIAKHLQSFQLVLNCAGPFSRTAKPMVEACLASKTHYLDITGEIEVFEMIKSYTEQAQKNGVILLPGVGFDVVPTDCIAQFLHTHLPDATHVALAFTSVGGSISHGTMTTMLENLGNAGSVRENGQIVAKPTGHKGRLVDFGTKQQFVMTIPWGDVSTAYHTTGIPNIETYIGVPKAVFYAMKLQSLFNPIIKSSFIKNLLQDYVDKKVTGPTESQSQKGKSLIWGQATNSQGKSVEARLSTSEGYKLTAEASLLITQKVLNLKDIAGYQTPAGLFGYELVLEIEGSVFVK